MQLTNQINMHAPHPLFITYSLLQYRITLQAVLFQEKNVNHFYKFVIYSLLQ